MDSIISSPDSSRAEKNSKGGIWQNPISSRDRNQSMLVAQLERMFGVVVVFLEICLCSSFIHSLRSIFGRYHRFRFYATIGGFSSKENCFGCRQSDTIYGNEWGEPALRVTVFSYRWRAVYLFSEGFRVQNIATILHFGCTFLKKLIKLYRETSTVNYPAERVAA